jgi:hypothetical protein
MSKPIRPTPGDDDRWLVPRRLTRGFELYPGWGITEGAIVLVGAIGAIGIFVGAWLAGSLVAALFGFLPAAVVVLGASVIVAMPLPFSDPLWRHLQGAKRFLSSQKTWLYRFGDDGRAALPPSRREAA